MPTHEAKNRAFWDRDADEYQALHGAGLAETPTAWGVWRIPESEVGALGETAGRDILELGCGAARWSIALAAGGSTVTGIDLSSAQLGHARRAIAETGAEVRLVHGSAEALPFRDGAFDLVFGDHGALSFADPLRAVPEAARVLRSGGRLAFAIASPVLFLCWDPESQEVDDRLHGEYFSMRSAEDETTIQFQLPYGEWIGLFRRCGLEVMDLVHLRPPEGATTTYDIVTFEWARRWPAEDLWVAAKC